MLVVDNVTTHGMGDMMQKFLDTVKNHAGLDSEILEVGNGLLVATRKD